MGAATNLVTEPADRVLTITRIFDAPRSLVFKAWTDSDHIARWWGPRGFKSDVIKNDLRPGGSYRIHMLGPDGDHWTQGLYREVVPPERLVMVGSWADAQGNPTRPETTLTLLFEDVGGKTKLTLHNAIFESVTARDLHNGGWNSSLDCLAEYLATA
ncbi:MAG TPA: SRPBCC domain-containing protein [Candidatus Acidoferrales bacterium]|jgi:uncharacterized protein YndB with AHSA1/START domain|nr:SRPBCC domain-containing protein [Candidatus Acidoferrales bacterium]